jgi:hypothetical protein
VARTTTSREFFGLVYLPGGEGSPQSLQKQNREKIYKTAETISKQAAKMQTSNPTNQARKMRKQSGSKS